MSELTYPCIKIVGEADLIEELILHLKKSGKEPNRLGENAVGVQGTKEDAQAISAHFPHGAVAAEALIGDDEIGENIFTAGECVSAVARRDWGPPAAYPPTHWMLSMLRHGATNWE